MPGTKRPPNGISLLALPFPERPHNTPLSHSKGDACMWTCRSQKSPEGAPVIFLMTGLARASLPGSAARLHGWWVRPPAGQQLLKSSRPFPSGSARTLLACRSRNKHLQKSHALAVSGHKRSALPLPLHPPASFQLPAPAPLPRLSLARAHPLGCVGQVPGNACSLSPEWRVSGVRGQRPTSLGRRAVCSTLPPRCP